jgi:hypothetical protein
MNVAKVGGKKNFGYGRSVKYAVRCAILDRYGPGRFGTRHSTQVRLRQFVDFLKKSGVKDLRDVTPQVVEDYCRHLQMRVQDNDLEVSSAVSLASAVNVLMTQVRKDRECWVPPSKMVGRRCYVRKTVPASLDLGVVDDAVGYLRLMQEERLAVLLELCRHLGLRIREASLLRLRKAANQARLGVAIQITRGTKGGRTRQIIANDKAKAVLRAAVRVVKRDPCLVPRRWTYIRWSRYCYRKWRMYADFAGLSTKFSDLRAGFACQLYESATGVAAPVVTDGRTATSDNDIRGRQEVSTALGHARHQIAGAYVGTKSRKKQ